MIAPTPAATTETHTVKIAIVDLYDNIVNEGMRCIKELILECDARYPGLPVRFEVFETRYKAEIPSLDFDIYVSTGGPGSPFDGRGKKWEKLYFDWWQAVWENNQNPARSKKHVLAICHSFQMMVRFFDLAKISRRKSKSFGVVPIYKTQEGEKEPLFEGLDNPFYAADFRDWQAIEADHRALRSINAKILSREKIRPHVPMERSITGIRVSDEIAGLQFHPEADADSMLYHAKKPERREEIIKRHGLEKYNQFLHRLRQPEYLDRTRKAVIPRFLSRAIHQLRPELSNGEEWKYQ